MFFIPPGSRTPHYGSMTPSHDGSRTPLHGGAWDPSSANTPARSEAEFDYSLDVPTPSPIGVSNQVQIFHTGYYIQGFFYGGASVAHLSERAPFTSANVGSIPVGNDL